MNNIIPADVDFYPVSEPILEILDAILRPAIAVVVAVGTIYRINLGVKISKTDEQDWGGKGQEGPHRCHRRVPCLSSRSFLS